MKHVYYGLKNEIGIYKSTTEYKLLDLKFNLEFSTSDLYRDFIESEIKKLKSNKSCCLVFEDNCIATNEIFITEKNHEYTLEVNDSVEIGSHKGIVKSRRYDVVNDIMYYYTNIIILSVYEEDFENKIKKVREYALRELQSLYNEYFLKTERKAFSVDCLVDKKSIL